ncbi:MAG: NADH-quinone oxidoreductase subunit K [Candidatus Bathyarchaeota archaeon]|nr:NADH-quinone oxidoreductase subunit K [Candidatus Bathyarchaeota archaeon]MDH5788717.1 NADH-quinone oxidoreductase subunit K [Candidatus Bathyarchaeota archaeon]
MNYVILSVTLLAIGIYGLLTKRHLLKVLVSIELIATAASMNFVLLASSLNKALGEAFLILAFSTDTCVTAIILALLVIFSRKYGTRDIRKLARLERNKENGSEIGEGDA